MRHDTRMTLYARRLATYVTGESWEKYTCPLAEFLCSKNIEYDKTYIQDAYIIMKAFRECHPNFEDTFNRMDTLHFLKTKNCNWYCNIGDMETSFSKHGVIVGLRLSKDNIFGTK